MYEKNTEEILLPMMEELGFPMGAARFPMRELTESERRTIQIGLKELGLLPEKREE